MKYFKYYPETFKQISNKYKPFINRILSLIKIIDDLFEEQIDKKTGVIQIDLVAFEKQKNNLKNEIDPYKVSIIKDHQKLEIPYYKYYHNYYEKIEIELKTIIDGIKKKKIITDNNQYWLLFFRTFLKVLKNDNWIELEKIFLKTPEKNKFIFSVGPIERYHDKVFGIKRFFSAWFIYREGNIENNKYFEIWKYLNKIALKINFLKDFEIEKNKKIRLFFGNLIAESGEVAKLYATGWSRPEKTFLLDKYGSIKIIAKNKYIKKIKEEQNEIKKSIEKVILNKKLKNKLLKTANYIHFLTLITHEFAHTLIKSSYSSSNLKNYYTFIEEGRAQANMIYLLNLLEQTKKLKRINTSLIIVNEILRLPYLYNYFIKNKQRIEYLLSSTLWFIFSLELRLIKIKDKKIHFSNFNKNEVKNFSEKLFIFYNTISYFGHHENKNLEKFFNYLLNKSKSFIRFF